MYTNTNIEMVTKKRFERERNLKKEAEKLLERKTTQLYEAQVLLKKKMQNLTESIQYALRIQHAILPSVQKFNGLFQDHFIIYKPKDIVSGDFYWCTKIDNKVVLAVLDCTGHGVPGAFMSMIGNTLLNEIVVQNNVLNPSEILKLLNNGIKNCFQTNEDSIGNGMDLGLCVLDYKNQHATHLSFAGAKHKLYIARRNELLELKSCRKSIGGQFNKEQPFIYKTHKLSLLSGDQLYLTTDGYIDQANPERKRFGIEKFKSLLKLVCKSSMTAQKDVFEKALKMHQGDTDQRDDITLLGIKI